MLGRRVRDNFLEPLHPGCIVRNSTNPWYNRVCHKFIVLELSKIAVIHRREIQGFENFGHVYEGQLKEGFEYSKLVLNECFWTQH